jgi:hypothetical protein
LRRGGRMPAIERAGLGAAEPAVRFSRNPSFVGEARRRLPEPRDSTDGQTTENQRRELEAVAARSGWEVVSSYETSAFQAKGVKLGRGNKKDGESHPGCRRAEAQAEHHRVDQARGKRPREGVAETEPLTSMARTKLRSSSLTVSLRNGGPEFAGLLWGHERRSTARDQSGLLPDRGHP